MTHKFEFIPQDTTPEAYREQIEALRRLGPEGRARIMGQLCRGIRLTAEAGILHRHPEYDPHTLKLALIRLTAGEEVFRRLLPGVEVEL